MKVKHVIAIDVKLSQPFDVEVSNEKFAIVNDSIAQYSCEINGPEWIFRAAHITDEDISGMFSEYNEFVKLEY